MGRGKVVVRPIACTTSRQVTFSKRRKGLLKKARELGILCDAEVGVIIFSSTGKRYEFGSPGMKSVIERYNKHTMKLVENSQIDSSQISNMWQKKVIGMKQEIKRLQHNNRMLTGEDLGELSLRDLHDLCQRLSMSLNRVRARKEEILMDELEELNRRERCLYEENMNLHSMISMLESSRVAPAGHDFCFESMKYSEAEGESSEAAISVPNVSLQLNLADFSES